MTGAGARGRILDAATALFYRDGINNVGVDRVIAEAGIAKMTLYKHFRSKDDLVLAFLEKIGTEWMEWLRTQVASSGTHEPQRPLAVFDALEVWFGTPEFRGCPLIGTAAEFRDPAHPAHRAAWRFKRELREFFRELLERAGHPSPESLADQLLLLADGAIVRAAMEGGTTSAKTARLAAAVLLG